MAKFLISQKGQQREGEITVGEVVQLKKENSVVMDWLEQFKSKDTLKTYDYILKSFFNVTKREYINNNMVVNVKYNDVQKYLKKMFAENKSNNTIQTHISCLNSLYEFAIDEGLVNNNPFSGRRIKKLLELNLTKGKEIVGTALSKGEIKKLLDGIVIDRDRILIGLMLRTGLRLHEVLKVKWNDFKNINNKWILSVVGKSNKIRYIEIGDKMISELKEYSKWKAELGVDDKKIFEMSKSNVNKLLKKYCIRSGIKSINPHDTRRTVCTHLLRDGVNPISVQQMMGHSKLETTLSYLREIDVLENNAGGYINW